MEDPTVKPLIPQIKPESGIADQPASQVGSTLIPEVKVPEANIPNLPPRKRFPVNLSRRKIGLGLTVLLVIALLLIIVPLVLVGLSAKRFYASAKNLEVAAKAQDITKIRQELKNTDSALGALKNSYRLASWMRVIPFAGSYVADAGHAIYAADYGLDAGTSFLNAIEPYADIVG